MHKIEPKPSRLLGLLLMGMTVLSLAALWLAAIPGVIQLGLGIIVAGWVMRGWRRARMTEALQVTADGMLQCQDEQGEWQEIEVLGDSLVTPALIVLRYRLGTQRVRTQVLLPDSADADDLRRLRVSLRWARHTRSDTTSPDAG